MGRMKRRVIAVDMTAEMLAIAFHPDGEHLLSGSLDGLRQWRIADGTEAKKRTMKRTSAISVSRNKKWIVCGTHAGASVWDLNLLKMAIEVEGMKIVSSVDISPDSTRFATASTAEGDNEANVWNIVTGERLVGPLQHDSTVVGVKFSPKGERLATSCGDSIHVLDSHSGDQLITIYANLKSPRSSVTPIAWSNDGQQIFAASGTNKIFAFNSSSGSQLAESRVHNYNDDEDEDEDGDNSEVVSIALAANGKFLSSFAANSVSFWDTSTLARIGFPIEDSQEIRLIALSPDCGHIAAGRADGKITIHKLSDILPDSYGPFHAPIEEESDLETRENGLQQQQDETPSTSGVRDTKEPAMSPDENPTTASLPESENEGKVSDDDLLEAKVPTGTPAPSFAYDQPPSLVSTADNLEVEVTLLGSSQAITQLPDAPLATCPPEAPCAEEHHDTAELSSGIPKVKRWLQTVVRRGDKNQCLHQPDRLSREPDRPAHPRSRSDSQARGNTANEGPSRMAAAGSRVTVKPNLMKQLKEPKTKMKTTKGSNSNKGASSSEQGEVDPKTAGLAQQTNDVSPVVPTGVRIREEAGDATVSIGCKFNLPAWILCRSRVSADGTH